ncbi:bifunctional tetrahydrofolate synthase/dihydrofolate synthase [Zhongshania aliphaticivorans]|uniref:bifunctional tetrahydrofolate synthase/dihydrofolate synthase n=1 Tax=Zhongshania aliphaticivorans TaxID=1470434 RepID=UPI0012E5287B|nr:bifunctional tetrahydrofolate synthase/dihydrofolate synthase [Zhongshania aliphaticivorans]CAA0079645.1 Dihydrofolate synthase/folylpolyglutamate synthase [Zhongshania aliphaticivorans]
MRYTQLNDWLRWMETQHPRNIDLGLERIALVAKQLDIALDMPVVTVAGTNGKGSCVALLSAILGAQGYRVGAYTSPHLHQYHERIAIGGNYVDDASLCRAFAAVDDARGETSLTYFEFGTLAALLIFKQDAVDVAVLEVGLGGRLDAVNIIDADVAIVSSIAIDHEAWLGNDREVIGREKAGIFRPNRPAIIGDLNPPKSLLDYAVQIGAVPVCREKQFQFSEAELGWQWRGQAISGERLSYENLPYPAVLIDNAATVLQAVQYINLPVSESAIRQGLTSVSVAGRCQHIQYRGIEVVLDVAHNPASVYALRDHLSAVPAVGVTDCVFAVMADKAVAEIISIVKPCFGHWSLPPLLGNERAAQPDAVQALLLAQGISNTSLAVSFPESLNKAMSRLSAGDRLVVFGSFFTVAAAMTEIAD